MDSVGLRELRQNASELVRRVESGERVEVTVSGRPAERGAGARGVSALEVLVGRRRGVQGYGRP